MRRICAALVVGMAMFAPGRAPARAQAPPSSTPGQSFALAGAAVAPLRRIAERLGPAILSDGRAPLDRAAASDPTAGGAAGPRPAGLVASAPMILLGRRTLDAQEVPDLVAWMKRSGPAVRLGHDGGWSATLDCALQVRALTGATPTLVAAPAGATALAELVAGRIDVLCDAVPAALPEVLAGTVTAFVLASDERLASLWDVPTADQAGLPLFAATAWVGLYGESRTADIATLNASLRKVLADPLIVQALADAGWTPFPETHRSAKAHADLLAGEIERTRAAMTAAGMAP